MLSCILAISTSFSFVIRLELVFLIGASFEIGPNHVKPRVRPISSKEIFSGKDMI